MKIKIQRILKKMKNQVDPDPDHTKIKKEKKTKDK